MQKWKTALDLDYSWSVADTQCSALAILFSFNIICCMVSDPWYIEVGESILNSLNLYTKVEGGFASIRDVTTMQLEDHQHSFFLAET